MNNPKEILLKILDIIGYIEDKNTFVNRFMDMCQRQALLDVVQTLPQDKQEALNKKLIDTVGSAQQAQKVIKEIIGEKEYRRAIEKTAEQMLREYLETVMPTLNKQQQKNLNSYFSSL